MHNFNDDGDQILHFHVLTKNETSTQFWKRAVTRPKKTNRPYTYLAAFVLGYFFIFGCYYCVLHARLVFINNFK